MALLSRGGGVLFSVCCGKRESALAGFQAEPRNSAKYLTFLDEDVKWTHPRVEAAVLFMIDVGGERLRWFVRSTKLLSAIKALGPRISGVEVEVTRRGESLVTDWELTAVKA